MPATQAFSNRDYIPDTDSDSQDNTNINFGQHM